MSAPLPETSTLAMPYDKGVHEEHHIPMTANRLIISHLILVEPKVIFPAQIELVYLIPETPAMQQRWHITECIIAHKHIYTAHVFLLECGFDNQHSTLTRQVLDLHRQVCHIYRAYIPVCFGVLSLRIRIIIQDGHYILHRMLIYRFITRQAEVDTAIGIQRRYVKAFSTLNTFDEVWTIAIPCIHQQMRESDTTSYQVINQFQTQYQLGFEYIHLFTIQFIVFIHPFL